MSKTVFKYTLRPASGVIQMPKGAQVLSVHVQNGDPHLWALVDPSAEVETREFQIVGTGHPIEGDPGRFIGTVHRHGSTPLGESSAPCVRAILSRPPHPGNKP